MKILPTDLQILNTIYNKYYDKFVSFSKKDSDRSAKNFIPVDIKLIAQKLGVDVDIIFGRLYYHLEQKYGYKRPDDTDDTKVAFFTLRLESMKIASISLTWHLFWQTCEIERKNTRPQQRLLSFHWSLPGYHY